MKQNAQQVATLHLTQFMAGVVSACFAFAFIFALASAATAAGTDTGTHVTAPDATQADDTADARKHDTGSAIQSPRKAPPSTETMRTDSDESKPAADADMEAPGKTTK
jgi:hypothetical protein